MSLTIVSMCLKVPFCTQMWIQRNTIDFKCCTFQGTSTCIFAGISVGLSGAFWGDAHMSVEGFDCCYFTENFLGSGGLWGPGGACVHTNFRGFPGI